MLPIQVADVLRYSRASIRVCDVCGGANVVGGSRMRGRIAAGLLVRSPATCAAQAAATGADHTCGATRQVQVGWVW